MEIAGKKIGDGYPAFLIAEVAQAHEGSVGAAKAFIDVAADLGFDAIKFQMHFAEEESTLDEPFRIAMSVQDKTRYDYWKRMEFSEEEWKWLFDHATKRGLVFLCSPFSLKAARILNEMGVAAWKLSSGEFQNKQLLQFILSTKKPVLASTGMCKLSEVASLVDSIAFAHKNYALFQCTSLYPTPLNKVGINAIPEFKQKFHCPVGLSDHSGSPYPSMMAIAMGANLIEVHIALYEKAYGPDTTSSLVPSQLKQVVEARNAMFTMAQNPVDKDEMAKDVEHLRKLFTKSIGITRDLPAGTVLTAEHLTLKKPGTGISEAEWENIIGSRLVHDVKPDRLLKPSDLQK